MLYNTSSFQGVSEELWVWAFLLPPLYFGSYLEFMKGLTMEKRDKKTVELQNQLRERLCAILLEKPFFQQLNHVDISKALVQSAFAWRDFRGGIDDICHAAKCLHQLVDEAAAETDPEYTHEKLNEYLRKTGQI